MDADCGQCGWEGRLCAGCVAEAEKSGCTVVDPWAEMWPPPRAPWVEIEAPYPDWDLENGKHEPGSASDVPYSPGALTTFRVQITMNIIWGWKMWALTKGGVWCKMTTSPTHWVMCKAENQALFDAAIERGDIHTEFVEPY